MREYRLDVVLQKQVSFGTKIMRQGHAHLPAAIDLAELVELGMVRHGLEIFQAVSYRNFSPLGKNVGPGYIIADRGSGFDYRLVLRSLKDVPEGRCRQFYHLEPLHRSVKVRVRQNELVQESVDADILFLCVIFEGFERRVIQPERCCRRFWFRVYSFFDYGS